MSQSKSGRFVRLGVSLGGAVWHDLSGEILNQFGPDTGERVPLPTPVRMTSGATQTQVKTQRCPTCGGPAEEQPGSLLLSSRTICHVCGYRSALTLRTQS